MMSGIILLLEKTDQSKKGVIFISKALTLRVETTELGLPSRVMMNLLLARLIHLQRYLPSLKSKTLKDTMNNVQAKDLT